MKNGNTFVNVLISITCIVLIFCGILMIQTLDRIRASNYLILQKLNQKNTALKNASASKNDCQINQEAKEKLANAEYFPQDIQNDSELHLSISSEPPNLNVVICNEYSASVFTSLCNSPLAMLNWSCPDGEYEPFLAKSWQISPDKLSYKIKLRKGVKWQSITDPDTGKVYDHQEVTAYDFKFFLDVVRNPLVNCAPLRVYYQDLDYIKIVNDYEFIVRWKKPFYGSRAATLSMTPLARFFYHSYPGKFDPNKFNDDHKRNRMLPGCGPFRLVQWLPNRKLVFERNEQFFGLTFGIKPAAKKITYDLIQLSNTRFQALTGKQIDMLSLTPEQWIRQAGTQTFSQNYQKFKFLTPTYSFIAYNEKNLLFQDKNVRKALTMLIDRPRIKKEILHNLAENATGPFFPLSKYSNPDISPLPFAPETAAALLKQSNWQPGSDGILQKNNQRFSFTMLQIANHPLQSKIFPLIKESLATVGIEMKIQIVEWSVFIDRINNRNFDACSLGWAGNFDPDPYQIWHSDSIPSPGSNFIGYANKKLDKLIEEMRSSFDDAKRVTIAHQIHKIIHDDQPYTFLFYSYHLLAADKMVKNVKIFPDGVHYEIIYREK